VLPFSDWLVLIFQHNSFVGEADLRAEPLSQVQIKNLRLATLMSGLERNDKHMATPAVFPESPSSTGDFRGQGYQPKLIAQ